MDSTWIYDNSKLIQWFMKIVSAFFLCRLIVFSRNDKILELTKQDSISVCHSRFYQYYFYYYLYYYNYYYFFNTEVKMLNLVHPRWGPKVSAFLWSNRKSYQKVPNVCIQTAVIKPSTIACLVEVTEPDILGVKVWHPLNSFFFSVDLDFAPKL